MFSDKAHGVRFVHQHHGARFLGNAHHFLERRDIAQHGVNAFQDHQLAGIFRQAFQPLFQRLDIVMAERHDLGIAHRAAIVDRGVAVDVQQHIIVLAGDGADNPQIGLISGREYHGVIEAVKFLQGIFAFAVPLIGAVQHAATGGAGAEFVQRLLARRDHVGIEGHAHIIIGAEQDRLLAVHHRHGGRLHLFHHQRKGIALSGGKQRFALLNQRIEFGEKIGHRRALSPAIW